MGTLNVLAVGDIVGQSGLNFLKRNLSKIKANHSIDFTVVNGENSNDNLLGITPDNANIIFESGADVITLGNHTFNRKNIVPYLDQSNFILRPANFAPQVAGKGYGIYDSKYGNIAVINLIGRCEMDFGPDNPFLEVERILKKIDAKFILIDFHASATSEKQAMGYHLDGRISALWGTHTHVQTSDATVLPNGTGYVTDLGMTGAVLSVIGARPQESISMFFGNPRQQFLPAEGPAKLEYAVFSLDTSSGKCISSSVHRLIEER